MQALCSLEAIHEQLMSLSPIAQPAQVPRVSPWRRIETSWTLMPVMAEWTSRTLSSTQLV